MVLCHPNSYDVIFFLKFYPEMNLQQRKHENLNRDLSLVNQANTAL